MTPDPPFPPAGALIFRALQLGTPGFLVARAPSLKKQMSFLQATDTCQRSTVPYFPQLTNPSALGAGGRCTACTREWKQRWGEAVLGRTTERERAMPCAFERNLGRQCKQNLRYRAASVLRELVEWLKKAFIQLSSRIRYMCVLLKGRVLLGAACMMLGWRATGACLLPRRGAGGWAAGTRGAPSAAALREYQATHRQGAGRSEEMRRLCKRRHVQTGWGQAGSGTECGAGKLVGQGVGHKGWWSFCVS